MKSTYPVVILNAALLFFFTIACTKDDSSGQKPSFVIAGEEHGLILHHGTLVLHYQLPLSHENGGIDMNGDGADDFLVSLDAWNPGTGQILQSTLQCLGSNEVATSFINPDWVSLFHAGDTIGDDLVWYGCTGLLYELPAVYGHWFPQPVGYAGVRIWKDQDWLYGWIAIWTGADSTLTIGTWAGQE